LRTRGALALRPLRVGLADESLAPPNQLKNRLKETKATKGENALLYLRLADGAF
jgi:hypothetical protein